MKDFLDFFFSFFNRFFGFFLLFLLKEFNLCYLVFKKLLLKLECRILRDFFFKKCFLDIGFLIYIII